MCSSASALFILICYFGSSQVYRQTAAAKIASHDQRDAGVAITDGIQHLVDTIDDEPYALHFDRSVSSVELVKQGPLAIRYVIPLMLSDNVWTRIRAQHVLADITINMYGYRNFAEGWPSEIEREKWETHWNNLGNFDAKSSSEERMQAHARWTAYYGIKDRTP